MPLYEYRCSKCGNVFEVLEKFAGAPLTVHPGCGGAVERLISTSALQFKGSGWYVNDYAKSPPPGKSEGKDGKTESQSESKAEGKSDGPAHSKDAKPNTATKTESKTPTATKTNE
jgi:putative FmdB family regulatory protein